MGKHGTYYWKIDHHCQVSLKPTQLAKVQNKKSTLRIKSFM